MASDQFYSTVITGNWFRDYGYDDNDGRSFRPVITGHYRKPTRQEFVDRTPPNAGDGNYYKFIAGPDVESAPRMDLQKLSLIASLDAVERISLPNAFKYNQFYTDGVYGYVAVWDAHDPSNPAKSTGTGRLWRKRYISSSGNPPQFRYEFYDSGWVWNLTLGEWSAYVNRHLHDHMSERSEYGQQWTPSNPGSGASRPSYLPGYDAFLTHREFGMLPGKYELVAASAYLDQAKNLPVANVNSFTTVLETANVVKNLVTRNFGGISSLLNPKNAWLAYRYSYTTTKSDIDEYVKLTSRLTNIIKQDAITSHGYAYSGSTSCHCTAHYDPQTLLPNSTRKFLEQYGLKLSLVNVWDMIPYSFVVDWFFHIGTFLQDLEDRGNMLDLVPTDVWYSFSNFESNGHGYYFRVLDRPHYNAPFVGPSPASTRTTLMRVADAVSLFT